MLKSQCISITELRKNTSQCLENLNINDKYVFINNKPVAVIMDIDKYENIMHQTSLQELNPSQLSPNTKREAEQARQTPENSFLNI